jgi:hypothetical protein
VAIFKVFTCLLVACLAAPSISAANPSIHEIQGTVASGQTVSIYGSNLFNEDRSQWDPFFQRYPNASSFEGVDPRSDGYSRIGPKGGTYVDDVKILDNQSMKFHEQGASPPGTILGTYNAMDLSGGDWNDWWVRTYVRWYTHDDTWPRSHIKMIMNMSSSHQGVQYYFEPGNGAERPYHMAYKYDTRSRYAKIPSGQLENHRWYCVELHWRTDKTPFIFDAWMDGIKIVDATPDKPGALNYFLFGPINLNGTEKGFSLDNWFDGLAVGKSRVYPAAVVEIGDSPQYGTAEKVYQEPVYISDNLVKAKVNLSGLGDGPYYLWITNNRQERSEAFPASLQAEIPSPKNLRIMVVN